MVLNFSDLKKFLVTSNECTVSWGILLIGKNGSFLYIRFYKCSVTSWYMMLGHLKTFPLQRDFLSNKEEKLPSPEQ